MDASVPDPNHILRGTAVNPVAVTPPDDPTQAALFGRGSYIVNAVVGCSNCHTFPDRDRTTQAVNTASFMTGGAVFAAGPLAPVVGAVRTTSANLVGTHGFFNNPNISFQMFLTAITEGIHAETRPADAGAAPALGFPMPWTEFRNMGVDDLEAVYTYFRSIAQHATTTGTSDVKQQLPARYCASAANCNAGETCAATNECTGGACSDDSDCGTCQTCVSSVCTAPAANSACVLGAEQL